MSQDDDIAMLRQAPLFGLLEPDALRLIAFAAESRMLKRGDILFRKGDHSDGGYVVTKGAIALQKDNEKTPTFIAEEGCLIGQLALFLRIPRPATATAREPTSVLRVSPTLMRRVLEEFPNAAPSLQSVLAEDLSTLNVGLDRVRQRLLAIDRIP